MLKLNVLLAKTDHLAASFAAQIRDYLSFFIKGGKNFTGEKNTYEPLPDTVDYPSERSHRKVVTTVKEKLAYFVETSAEYINAKFAQEKTNSLGVAQADLIVEGVNWGRFTSLELLALKSLLTNNELTQMYEHIPVRADDKEWERSTEESYTDREIFQSPLIRGEKKTVTKEQYILADPNVQYLKDTSKYQPVTATKDTPQKLGDYTYQTFSGEWTPRQRALLLRRRTTLLNAVIEAIKVANEAPVEKSELTAERIFGYLHG